MKELIKKEINEILDKKFNIEQAWIYTQFHKIYEKNIWIFEINLKQAIDNFLKFLESEEINEILFFPEPTFDFENVGAKILKIEEINSFLLKNVSTVTNNHISDLNLKWIFTFGHEEDFLVSGEKEFIDKAIKYFKDAKIEESNKKD